MTPAQEHAPVAAPAPAWLTEAHAKLYMDVPEADIVPLAVRNAIVMAGSGAIAAAQFEKIKRGLLATCIDLAVEMAHDGSKNAPYWRDVAGACARCRAAVLTGDDVGRALREAARALSISKKELSESSNELTVLFAAKPFVTVAVSATLATAVSVTAQRQKARGATWAAEVAGAALKAAQAAGGKEPGAMISAIDVTTTPPLLVGFKADLRNRLFIVLLDLIEMQIEERQWLNRKEHPNGPINEEITP